MNQAMNGTFTFESDAAKDAYIETLITETDKLEVNATFAKKFVEMYESSNFQAVMLKGLLGTHMHELIAVLVDPQTTEELEEEVLYELRSLRYLNKFLTDNLASASNAERLVTDNKQLLLDVQSAEIEDE